MFDGESVLYKLRITEDGDDHPVLENLERTIADEVDAVDGVRLVNNKLAGGAEHGLDLHRDRLEAALARLGENGQGEYLTMQVYRNVALHLDRKVLQHLCTRIAFRHVTRNVTYDIDIVHLHTQ